MSVMDMWKSNTATWMLLIVLNMAMFTLGTLPWTVLGLICLALADGLGTVKPGPRFSNEGFLYDRLRIYRETMARPFVEGKDLLAAGLAPGPEMGEFLAYAHKLRLAGVEKSLALKQTLAFAEKYRRKHER